jgi:hypothetical protein
LYPFPQLKKKSPQHILSEGKGSSGSVADGPHLQILVFDTEPFEQESLVRFEAEPWGSSPLIPFFFFFFCSLGSEQTKNKEQGNM